MKKKLFNFAKLAIFCFPFLVMSSLVLAADENSQLPVSSTERIEVALENVEFVDFHDPGWMELKFPDGNIRNVGFSYSNIPYEDISEWQVGEKIALVFSSVRGTGIVKSSSNVFYRLSFGDLYPIERLVDQCVDSAMDTASYRACYLDGGARAKIEGNIRLEEFQKSASPEFKQAAEQALESWDRLYADLLAINKMKSERNRGTISIIEDAVFYYGLQIQRARTIALF